MKHISTHEGQSQNVAAFNRGRIQGVGIDLVGCERIKNFVRVNTKRQCERLLSSTEAQRWQESNYSHLTFAKYFTAKEAYFKALDREWLGVDGFSQLEIDLDSENSFTARDLQSGNHESSRVSGSIFQTDELIGAQAIVWEF